MSVRKIKCVVGPEPLREGERPVVYTVGSKVRSELGPITEILLREENRGSYGIDWYDVWIDDALVCSLNAMHVAEVQYGVE